MLGSTAVIAGLMSVGEKFIGDMVAYASYGKSFSSLESYFTAFAISGLTKGFGFTGIDKYAISVILRPAADQYIALGIRGKLLDRDKYIFDIINRGLTEFLPVPIKAALRGLNSGYYSKNKDSFSWSWLYN